MDPFEEFEFKPLTEGLGFHKKAETPVIGAQANRTPEAPQKTQETAQQRSQSITDLIASLPPSLDFLDESSAMSNEPTVTSNGIPAKTSSTDFKTSIFGEAAVAASQTKPSGAASIAAPPAAPEARTQIFQPLGRKDYEAKSAADVKAETKKTNAMPAPTLKSNLTAQAGAEGFARSFPHLDKKTPKAIKKEITPSVTQAAPMKRAQTTIELRKVSASFSAATLDAMVITGFATIFLVSTLLITQVDLIALLSNANTDVGTYLNLVMLFFVVLHLYMLSARGVFGATLGEWAFDMQLGLASEQVRPIYYVKLIWRMIMIAGTGFITLPILSKLMGRDLPALLGASQIYVRVPVRGH